MKISAQFIKSLSRRRASAWAWSLVRNGVRIDRDSAASLAQCIVDSSDLAMVGDVLVATSPSGHSVQLDVGGGR